MRRRTLVLGLTCCLALADVFTLAAGCGGDDTSSASGGDGGPGDASLDQSVGDATGGGDATGDGGITDAARDGDAANFPTPDAAPFVVDTGYGTNGVLTVNFNKPSLYEMWTAVRQADGKVILGGGAGDALFLARYTTTGALDATFGTGGVVLYPVGKFAMAESVMVQADQKIVAVGEFSSIDGAAKTVVARFDTTGAVDTGFGQGGRAVTNGFAWSGALQPDGSILAAVNTINPTGLTVYRFLANGTLDPAFGTGGAAFTTIAGTGIDPFAVMALADGKILVGGNTGGFTLFFVRFTSAGALDTTFNGTGALLEFQSSSAISEVAALLQEPDGGRIYAGGLAQGTLGVGRYFVDGGRDPSFGPGSIPGWATRGSGGYVNAMALQDDGKVVIGGAQSSSAGAVRFTNEGGVDNGFGTNGFATAIVGDNAVHGLALNPDGTLVFGGQSGSQLAYNAQITRMTSAGTTDTTFGTNGLTTTSGISGSFDDGLALALSPGDGKALLLGDVQSGITTTAQMIRATTAGVLDTTFGGAGKEPASSLTHPGSVLMQSTSKAVACATSQAGVHLTRYDTAGSLDGTFGSSGQVNLSTIAGQAVTGTSMAVGPSNAIVVLGRSNGGQGGFAVEKLTADGQADATFGGGVGVVTPSSVFGATVTSSSADAAAIQSDGKVVVAGRALTSLAVVRYTTAGVLDATFGTAGVMHVELGAQTLPYAVFLLADGSILVGAERFNADLTADVILLHVTSSGVLDTSYGVAAGVGGYPLFRVEHPDNEPAPVGFALTADGRVVVAAATSSDAVDEHLLLLRFSTSGLLDAKSLVTLGPGTDVGHGVAVQSDGKIVVGGRTWTFAGGEDYFVARFTAP